jgi:hypothetical protein
VHRFNQLAKNVSLALLGFAFASAASGSDNPKEPEPSASSAVIQGDDVGGFRSLLPASGTFRFDTTVFVNLSKDETGEPVQLAPDLWYGVTDRFALGVVHSSYNTVGFYGYGGGICVSGEDQGCSEVYDNVGARGLYQFKGEGEGLLLAADAGLMAATFDPTVMSVRLGVLGAVRWPKASLEFNPAVDINVTEREGGLNEMLYVPVEMKFLAAPRLSLSFHSGVWTYLDSTEFGNSWVLPVGFGGMYQIAELFGLGARFTWPMLASGEGWDYLSTGDFRSLEVYLSVGR